jgi:hypothetical protein
MAIRVLIPIDSTAAESRAFDDVSAALPDDPYLVFIRILTPSEESQTARARSGLIRCLMLYRSRGVQSETQMIDADTDSEGIVDAISRFDIDQVLFIQGRGADDTTEIIAELRNLTSLPIGVTVDRSELATAG